MLNKSLSVLLILIILAVIVAIVWLAVVPEKGDRLTEFYILGAAGKADNYLKSLKAGDVGAVTVGIINREHEDEYYCLLIKSDDVIINKIEPIPLADNKKWEQQVNFSLTKVGDHQKVEFLLYKNGLVDPYLTLRLWIDVK